MKINTMTLEHARLRLHNPTLQAESMLYDMIQMVRAELKPGRSAAAAELNESASRNAFHRFTHSSQF